VPLSVYKRVHTGTVLTLYSCSPQTKSKEHLVKLGGVEGLAAKLGTSLSKGISTSKDADAMQRRRDAFGENRSKTVEMKSFWAMVYENLQDPTLILLMAAALVC